MYATFQQVGLRGETNLSIEVPAGTRVVDIEARFPGARNIVLSSQPSMDVINANALRAARQMRGRLLAACDWTQVADSPLSTEKKAEWAAYRQLLRDVTNQPDPTAIVWPTPPA